MKSASNSDIFQGRDCGSSRRNQLFLIIFKQKIRNLLRFHNSILGDGVAGRGNYLKPSLNSSLHEIQPVVTVDSDSKYINIKLSKSRIEIKETCLFGRYYLYSTVYVGRIYEDHLYHNSEILNNQLNILVLKSMGF